MLPEEAQVKRAAVALALSAALAVLTGCNLSSTPPNVHGGTNSHAVVTVNDTKNGRTVVIHTGDQLRVVLASTYWNFQAPAHGTVLSPHGETQVIPQLSHCVPGGG